MDRRLDKEYNEMEEDKVFIEEPSSLHEVASTNKITPDLLNSKHDLFITSPDGRRLIAKAELNPGAFLHYDYFLIRYGENQQLHSTKGLQKILFMGYY